MTIHVLVAEDSVTTRELLVAILRSDPELQVVGEAKNGAEAVERTRHLQPHVVTMDIRMPVMDGFEATKRIMIETPTPIVIVSGSLDVREVEVAMHALRAGALAVLPKPAGPAAPDYEAVKKTFLETVKAMSQVKVVRHWPPHVRFSAGPRPKKIAPARIIAMAASTGGPAALSRVLSDLPGNVPVPLLIVQHIAPGFGDGFVAWLNNNSRLRVKQAQQGERLLPGMAYVAPDGRHLGLSDPTTVLLSDAPPLEGLRPSATFLFESVARHVGSAALAVILTGMGRDGVAGLRAVREAGGRIVAQDEESAVVFGMPGAAVAAGLTDAVLPLSSIAPRLEEWCRSGGAE
ncbi:MAG: chemotaxis-specific protein-glutamate methyltransferase CheB [Planctomycetes bacterium]|nr:chemotaxis-specific protein-glutamate methyltransferase CheB [Planctomycetota bacterium]